MIYQKRFKLDTSFCSATRGKDEAIIGTFSTRGGFLLARDVGTKRQFLSIQTNPISIKNLFGRVSTVLVNYLFNWKTAACRLHWLCLQ
jgi:hypothetical protein